MIKLQLCAECNSKEGKIHCTRCERLLCENCFGKNWKNHKNLCEQCLFDLDDENNY